MLATVALPMESPHSLCQIKAQHRENAGNAGITLFYFDDEGDAITMTTQLEWEEMLRVQKDAKVKKVYSPIALHIIIAHV